MFDNGQLVFDPGPHTYHVAGRPLPSVTTCLKNSRIVDYSHIPQDVLLKASARGTAVHRIIEFDLTGGVDEESIDARLWGYVVAARKFISEFGLKPERVENRVYDIRYGYAGTFDVVGKLSDGAEAIVDWKTGLLLPGHRVQMAGYAHGTGEPLRYRRLLVGLRADGDYTVNEATRADYPSEFAVFAGAVATMQWRMKHERKALEEAA